MLLWRVTTSLFVLLAVLPGAIIRSEESRADREIVCAFERQCGKWNRLRDSLDAAAAASEKQVSPEEFRRLGRCIAQIKEEMKVLRPELEASASALWRSDASHAGKAVPWLFGLMNPAYVSGRYGDSLRIACALLENGERLAPDDRANVRKCAAMSAFCLNQFDASLRHLAILRENDQLPPPMVRFTAVAEHHAALWKIEEANRRHEGTLERMPRFEFQTSKGMMVIELFPNEAPETRRRVVALFESGAWEKSACRALPGGFFWGREAIFFESRSRSEGVNLSAFRRLDARHPFRGSVGVQMSERKNMRLVISLVPSPVRNHHFTVVGRVLHGMDIADELGRAARSRGTGGCHKK